MTIIQSTVESLPTLLSIKRLNELMESGDLFNPGNAFKDGADYLRSICDKLEDDEIINLMGLLRLDANQQAIIFSIFGDYYDHRMENKEILKVNDGLVKH